MALLILITGWVGAVLILLAYLLNSTGKLTSNSTTYQVINLSGALCLVVNTYSNNAFPATFLNIMWSIIAIYTLIKKRGG